MVNYNFWNVFFAVWGALFFARPGFRGPRRAVPGRARQCYPKGKKSKKGQKGKNGAWKVCPCAVFSFFAVTDSGRQRPQSQFHTFFEVIPPSLSHCTAAPGTDHNFSGTACPGRLSNRRWPCRSTGRGSEPARRPPARFSLRFQTACGR